MDEEAKHDLVNKAQSGDWNAFVRLWEPCRGRLYALCQKMLQSENEVEDAVSEALIRAWEAIKLFRSEAAFCTWLHTIAVRVCLDRLERSNKHKTVPLPPDLPVDEANIDALLFAHELLKKIYVKSSKWWKAEDWELFTLRMLIGLSYSEIAQLRGHNEQYWRTRWYENIQPVLDELGIEETLQEKTPEWKRGDLEMFSARVVRGKELSQFTALFKLEKPYTIAMYQRRIKPVLERIGLPRRVQQQDVSSWNTAEMRIFQEFLIEGTDFAAIAQVAEIREALELGATTAGARTIVRKCYHEKIKARIIAALKNTG